MEMLIPAPRTIQLSRYNVHVLLLTFFLLLYSIFSGLPQTCREMVGKEYNYSSRSGKSFTLSQGNWHCEEKSGKIEII